MNEAKQSTGSPHAQIHAQLAMKAGATMIQAASAALGAGESAILLALLFPLSLAAQAAQDFLRSMSARSMRMRGTGIVFDPKHMSNECPLPFASVEDRHLSRRQSHL